MHAQEGAPSAWVQRFVPLIPHQLNKPVLDLACGAGRHTRLLLAHGYEVLAIDRDLTALQSLKQSLVGEGAKLDSLALDVEQPLEQLQWPCAPASLAGIVVTNYLHRPLFPLLLASLAPNGVLIYETFAAGNQVFGKPSNPAFLLNPGELFIRMQESGVMRTLAFEDGRVEQPKMAMVQRICCIKAGHDIDLSRLGPL
ncbi:MAG: class I SAM-dependent methyltransferase [Burkholderiales bacterium]|nr:class I SAM-dependent methyltransferase [Burkholderiales bacterium]